MEYEYYIMLIGEYINCGRSSERLLGEIGYPADIKLTADGLEKAISIIGAAAENNIKQLIELSGLSMASFARKFTLPYRSVQNWCTELNEKRTPPEYLSTLIGYVLISEIEGASDET